MNTVYKPPEDSFTPPTAEQAHRYLDRYPPRGASKLLAWVPIIALGAAMMVSMTVESDWAAVLPWLTIAVVFVGLAMKMRQTRRLEKRITEVQEMALLRQYDKALRVVWRMVPSLAILPVLHGQAVILIAHCLNQIRSYEAAIAVYDYLINRLPTHDPITAQLRLKLAAAQLATDRLADADDTLRRLRGQIETLNVPALEAEYRLVCLIQQVRTNHWSDAATQANEHWIDQLRPLGLEAGFGYALLALSHLKQGSPQNPSENDQAEAWWSRATLLLPVRVLVDRFEELDQIAQLIPVEQPPRALGLIGMNV